MNNRPTSFIDTLVLDKSKYLIAEVVKEGKRWRAYDQFGNQVNQYIGTMQRQKAYNKGFALERRFYQDGRPWWKLVPRSEYEHAKKQVNGVQNFNTTSALNVVKSESMSNPSVVEVSGTYSPFETQKELIEFVQGSYALKPKSLFMKELKWKHLVRTVVRGKNTLVLGMQGSGKTLAAKMVSKILGRPSVTFPLGETQDPKGFLLGNSQFDKETGTVFYPSRFVRAIQTKGMVIVLDELSRAHPEAWNILMPVLDETQRYLVLDETRDNAVIPVAEGVTFVATANVGREFTATRVMDRALIDRFTIVEMDTLTDEEELELLKILYPELNENVLRSIATISFKTREEMKSETSKLSTAVSTRVSVEVGGLLYDGFGLVDCLEVCVYPFFSDDGGLESERTFVKQLAQGFIDDGSANNLFGPDDMEKARI
jgi:nitric oxide reductase NorQ protein